MGHLLHLLVTPQTWEVPSFNVTDYINIRGIFNFAASGLCDETKALINTGENCHILIRQWALSEGKDLKGICGPFLGAGNVSNSGASAGGDGIAFPRSP